MKRSLCSILCCAALMLCFLPDAVAQLAISMKISQLNYLQFEPIFVRITIKNFSAHPVIFGDSDQLRGSLSFDIIPNGMANRMKVQLKDPKVFPPVTGSIIAAGGSREYTFNLTDYYDLRLTGKYSIIAVVRHHLFAEEYISDEKFFNIVNGNVVWEMKVGVPDLLNGTTTQRQDNTKTVGTRKYSLISYSVGPSGRGQALMYNLRVEDDKMIYMNRRIAFDLGPEYRPQCEIDFLSRLHILIPSGGNVYAYYVFNLFGRLEKSQVLIRTGAKPVLTSDPKTGFVTVVGGREAQRDVDYEEIKGVPILGVRPDTATVATPPPKGEELKQYDAVPDK